jgi:hypothetical protein
LLWGGKQGREEGREKMGGKKGSRKEEEKRKGGREGKKEGKDQWSKRNITRDARRNVSVKITPLCPVKCPRTQQNSTCVCTSLTWVAGGVCVNRSTGALGTLSAEEMEWQN